MRAKATPFLLAALLLAGCATDPAPTGAGDAPEWSFTDTEGIRHSRDEPPANATVLFFMATWCGSCRSKAPVLAEAHAAYADKGVRFYSVDFDPSETHDELRAWMRDREQPWPHGLDEGLALQRTFGVTSQSSVVVLDDEGQVVRSWGYGRVTDAGLREALDAALA